MFGPKVSWQLCFNPWQLSFNPWQLSFNSWHFPFYQWQLSFHSWQLSSHLWQLSFYWWQLSFCHDNMTKLFPSVTKFFLHGKTFRSAKTFIVRERAGHSHACVLKKMALPGRCGSRDKCELNCQIFLSRKKENHSKPLLVWPVVISLPHFVESSEMTTGQSGRGLEWFSFFLDKKIWQFSSHLSRKPHLPDNAIFL